MSHVCSEKYILLCGSKGSKKVQWSGNLGVLGLFLRESQCLRERNLFNLTFLKLSSSTNPDFDGSLGSPLGKTKVVWRASAVLCSCRLCQQLICKNAGVSGDTNISSFSSTAFQVCLAQGRNGMDLWVGAWGEGLHAGGTPSLGTKTSVESRLLAVFSCALGH